MTDIGKIGDDLNIENLEFGYVRTRDHDEIKKWVETQGGRPQWFDDPEARADRPGIRIDFPGKKDEKYMQEAVEMKNISWESFFKLFDTADFDFIYKESPEDGEDLSMCYQFIKRTR